MCLDAYIHNVLYRVVSVNGRYDSVWMRYLVIEWWNVYRLSLSAERIYIVCGNLQHRYVFSSTGKCCRGWLLVKYHIMLQSSSHIIDIKWQFCTTSYLTKIAIELLSHNCEDKAAWNRIGHPTLCAKAKEMMLLTLLLIHDSLLELMKLTACFFTISCITVLKYKQCCIKSLCFTCYLCCLSRVV